MDRRQPHSDDVFGRAEDSNGLEKQKRKVPLALSRGQHHWLPLNKHDCLEQKKHGHFKPAPSLEHDCLEQKSHGHYKPAPSLDWLYWCHYARATATALEARTTDESSDGGYWEEGQKDSVQRTDHRSRGLRALGARRVEALWGLVFTMANNLGSTVPDARERRNDTCHCSEAMGTLVEETAVAH